LQLKLGGAGPRKGGKTKGGTRRLKGEIALAFLLGRGRGKGARKCSPVSRPKKNGRSGHNTKGAEEARHKRRRRERRVAAAWGQGPRPPGEEGKPAEVTQGVHASNRVVQPTAGHTYFRKKKEKKKKKIRATEVKDKKGPLPTARKRA